MAQYRSIEVDFDVHQRIEAARTSFEESPNEALRRLLNIPHPKTVVKDASLSRRLLEVRGARAWSDGGATLDHGTELQMNYDGEVFSGRVVDGEWEINGSRYTTASGAACALISEKRGKKTNVNGWLYWQYKRPGETRWATLQSLRPQFRKRM